ncbi:MAG: hypothetical protein L3J29_00335 [Cyclobacteriaceae bacterium]|nr:hypothetical protein [Cyclobacteriaceae bacterium]
MLNELLALKPSLWVQVGGMSSAISFGVFLFSVHQSINSNQGMALILVLELLIILFSVSTFSIYLTKRGFGNAEKLGLRKILGASGFRLFIEVSVRTTLLIILSIIISIGIMDVTTWLVGLSFEHIIQRIGILQFGTLLLVVFIVSEGVMFIIIGVALAPNLKESINKTTNFEKYWFEKLGKMLSTTSILLLVSIALLLISLLVFFNQPMATLILIIIFFSLLVTWCLYNKYRASTF